LNYSKINKPEQILEIFIATGQKLQIWPKRGDVGQSGILKHKRGIVCPSHYGF
jgi:hypothetical protein